MEESIKCFVGYIESMQYIGSMTSRNDLGWWKGEVSQYQKDLSSGTFIQLDNTSLLQSHMWVLHNTDEVQPWIE